MTLDYCGGRGANPPSRRERRRPLDYHRRGVTGRFVALLFTAVLLSCSSPGSTNTSGTAADALSRGLQAHTAGKFDEATTAYFETLAKDPKNKFAFYNLGEIAQRQNRPVAAEAYYRLAIEQDAKMTSALFNLAILRSNAGANQEAADLYRRVIAVEPNNAAAHFNLGLVLRLLGQNAVVLLISDGLDAEGGEGLAAQMERLHKSCRRLVWLNPLLRYEGFEARPAGIRAMLPHVDDFLPVHNMESLTQLAAALDHPHGHAPMRRAA